jgi:CxxH/CxxC protein (TIGR04129 family)
MIYCCEEHIDLALDDIVDQYETPPNLKKIADVNNLSTTCEYCNKPPIYMVTN